MYWRISNYIQKDKGLTRNQAKNYKTNQQKIIDQSLTKKFSFIAHNVVMSLRV